MADTLEDRITELERQVEELEEKLDLTVEERDTLKRENEELTDKFIDAKNVMQNAALDLRTAVQDMDS